MTTPLNDLKPKKIWTHFENLCAIPRPSKNEAKVVEYIKNFGEGLGLKTTVDAVGNIVICKPATAGMEGKKTVILQGHVDMVPQKNSDVQHDFTKDAIQPYVDGEWVKAKGTTLGADNGIGVAATLSVLEAKDIQHGPIEALFTVDEETGMTGANYLKPNMLRGEIMLNLDTEDEDEIIIGCAGGVNTDVTILKFQHKPEKKMIIFA